MQQTHNYTISEVVLSSSIGDERDRRTRVSRARTLMTLLYSTSSTVVQLREPSIHVYANWYYDEPRLYYADHTP